MSIKYEPNITDDNEHSACSSIFAGIACLKFGNPKFFLHSTRAASPIFWGK